MPSLQALGEFKSSFFNIGHEKQILEELELPPDDLPLPDHEPARENADTITGPAADFSADMPADTFDTSMDALSGGGIPDDSAGTDFIDIGDLGDFLGGNAQDAGDSGEFTAPGQEDIKFNEFIDSIPDDLGSGENTGEENAGEPEQVPSEAVPPGAAPSDSTESKPDDFNLPSELLDGFADEIEAERSSPGETEAGDEIADGEAAGEENFENLDLGDFPGFESGEALDLPGDNDADSTGAVEAETAMDFSLPDEISGLEDVEPDITTDADVPEGKTGFDIGEELSNFENGAVLEEIPDDSFDNFKLDTNAPGADFNPDGETGNFGGDFSTPEDFSLSGIDNVFDGKSPSAKGVSPGAGGSAGGKADRAAGEAPDEVEEIGLSDEELERLDRTLASYPLNLRIACEELIAEQAVAPAEMSKLVKLLVKGAPAGETAELAGKILNRTIPIPKGFEKKTGEALEAEQSSFTYIFIHNFLPVLRLFMMIALVAVSAGYLGWRFIYTPIKAESIYKLGLERIGAGEYSRANERFQEAFMIHEKKSWFYTYARAFRDARQYTLAEDKYQELLNYTAQKNKRHIPEKQAVLEFASMETNTIGNYQKADDLLRHNILDYVPLDKDGLLALGDNNLAWAEYDPSHFEDAREAYANYMEHYGRTDPLLERMLKYFIRTDNLAEVLPLQSYFMASPKRIISAPTLAELGGYLLDKRFGKAEGVPDEYLDYIGGIREILLRAIREDSMLPESYYHLARYYNYFDNSNDEKLTLEYAVQAFEAAKEENSTRIKYHIDTLRRYGESLINGKEFFPAEENLIKGINLYRDGVSRHLLTRSPEFGRLYADLGDLEYFVKDGNMNNALDYYHLGEQDGWAPPEIRYRMGAAYYQLRQWGSALDYITAASRDMPQNRRILYALGNVSYIRGNYFAAQGYYDRLIDMLEADRSRLPPIMPTNDEKQLDLAERLMVAQNNMGVTLEALTERTGDYKYLSRANSLFTDSLRAWDVITRNPTTMTRMRPSPDISGPGVNPAYLNIQNSLHPVLGYQEQFFLRIDRDILEPSAWEELAPAGYRLSQGIYTGH